MRGAGLLAKRELKDIWPSNDLSRTINWSQFELAEPVLSWAILYILIKILTGLQFNVTTVSLRTYPVKRYMT